MSQLYSWPLLFLLFLLLLVLSAFFSSSEAALMSLNRLRIIFLSHQKNPKAQFIANLLKKRKEMISTILVGNNFVNVAASSVATGLAISLWGKKGIIYASVMVTLILLIFGEIVPKIYASKFPEKISFLVARPIFWCMKLLGPVVSIINLIVDLLLKLLSPKEIYKKPLISEEEIQAVITLGEKEGVLEKDERRMLLNIFELANTQVKAIMTPRTEMICLEEDTPFFQIIDLVEESGRSRFPIYRKLIDNVIGIIHSRDLLQFKGKTEDFSFEKIIFPPFFIPESKRILSLLADFKKRKTHLALVIDEYGGIEGLVTLEDVLEEIVGDIFDESDLIEKWIDYLPDGRILVDGDASIREINKHLKVHLSHDEFQTLSGLIMNQLGHIPLRGEYILQEGYKFTVRSVHGQKIMKVEIYPLDQTTSNDQPER